MQVYYKCTLYTEQGHWISLAFSAVLETEIYQTDKVDKVPFYAILYSSVRGSMLSSRQLSVLSMSFWVGKSRQYKEQRLLYTAFTVIYRLWCNIEHGDKWIRSHGERGKIHPEVYYLQPAHIHTHTCRHIASRITKLCSKPATVHTSFIYSPHSTDGFIVVHLAFNAISGLCRPIGF